MMRSLCEACRHVKIVVSGKGSRFLLCTRATMDDRFHKYPVQPRLRCIGFAPDSDSVPPGDVDGLTSLTT